MADNVIVGELGILSIYDGSDYRPVGCLTSQSFDSELSVIERNTKCNPGVTTKGAGTINRTISGDGLLIDTTSVGGDTSKASWDYLFELQKTQAATKTPVEFRYDSAIVGAVYYGESIITSINLTQGSGDEDSTFSITLDVSGDVSTTNPNP